MPKLTKTLIEKTQPDPGKEIFLWDEELPGFGLRLYPSGRRVYVLQYRSKRGRQRRAAIGRHGPLTAEQARGIARDLLYEVHKGGDPAGDVQSSRNAPSMAELCERYLADYAAERKKDKSVHQDRRMIERFILPILGKRKVGEVNRADVVKLHHSLKGTPYQANRILALISKMMNLAERWGLRPDGSNPCRHVEKYKEQKRNRFLSEAELGHLAEVLADVEQTNTVMPSVIAAIRLLMFTGARLSEILTLEWDHVDLEGRCLRLADSKTGAKLVYLSPPAQEILASLERIDGNPFVITGVKKGSHLVNLEKPWRRIRAAAGLDDVRLHDLRHSFASMAVAGGLSLPVIGALLGHTQPATTARYAHLADDPLKQATDMVGANIKAAMTEGVRNRRG